MTIGDRNSIDGAAFFISVNVFIPELLVAASWDMGMLRGPSPLRSYDVWNRQNAITFQCSSISQAVPTRWLPLMYTLDLRPPRPIISTAFCSCHPASIQAVIGHVPVPHSFRCRICPSTSDQLTCTKHTRLSCAPSRQNAFSWLLCYSHLVVKLFGFESGRVEIQ